MKTLDSILFYLFIFMFLGLSVGLFFGSEPITNKHLVSLITLAVGAILFRIEKGS